MIKYSLPFRILIATCVILVLPLIFFGVAELRSAFLTKIEDAKKGLIEAAEQKREQLVELTSSKFLVLEEVSYLLDIPKLLPQLPNERTNEMFKILAQT